MFIMTYSLVFRLTKTSTKYLTRDVKVRKLLDNCQSLWPRLHVSCRIGSDGMLLFVVDVNIIMSTSYLFLVHDSCGLHVDSEGNASRRGS